MRQCGILAAAGIYAFERNLERLAEDHALARDVAAALHGLPGLVCPPEEVETNIVMVQVLHPELDAAGIASALEKHGVLTMPMSDTSVRFVTHLDVGREDVERLRKAARAVLR
jgi:threonine aldolase